MAKDREHAETGKTDATLVKLLKFGDENVVKKVQIGSDQHFLPAVDNPECLPYKKLFPKRFNTTILLCPQ